MSNSDAFLDTSSNLDGFKTSAERNIQSVKDALKKPVTVLQIQQTTNLTREEVIANLQKIAEEKSLGKQTRYFLV